MAKRVIITYDMETITSSMVLGWLGAPFFVMGLVMLRISSWIFIARSAEG
jgi:hypothetical protein